MNKEDIVNSKAYRLTSPEKFEEVNLQHKVYPGQIVVQPSLASICHADLRYYTGERREEALKRKLPMALFHEGIGYVIKSNSEFIDTGERVVIVPNIPARRLKDKSVNDNLPRDKRNIKDNYLPSSIFLGSGYDGIGQEKLVLPEENVVPIPNDVPDEIATLTELTSVSLNGVDNVSDYLGEGKVAVFGDGPVGYLTASTLHHVYNVPSHNLLVFGAISERLKYFDFATTQLVQNFNFREEEKNVVTVFECTGGTYSKNAINQAIDLVEPQGKIVLMGVTEEYVPLNTRDVLEKGLAIYGSSRSTEEEFKTLIKAFQNQDFQKTLQKLIPTQNELIRNAADLEKALDKAADNKDWGKMFLSLEWE